MGKKRKPVEKPPPPQPDRHKPRRMVGIPEPLALALESIAAEEFNSLAEQVKAACRKYLQEKGRLPAPGSSPPKS